MNYKKLIISFIGLTVPNALEICVMETNFVFSLKHKLMNKLFIKYLSENYEFHINANPNILYRNIHNESSVLTLNILQPLILIFTDCLFFILVIRVLFFTPPPLNIILFTSDILLISLLNDSAVNSTKVARTS